MILVVAAALGVGWITHQIRGRRAALAALEAADVVAAIRDDTPSKDDPWTARLRRRIQGLLTPWVGGEVFLSFDEMTFNDPVRDDLLAHLGWFPEVESLSMMKTGTNLSGWDRLARLPNLKSLILNGPGVDDAALRAVGQIRSLEDLNLEGVAATDAGFAALADLPNVLDLNISKCPRLSDAGAARLFAGLPRLEFLFLNDLPSNSRTATVTALARHHPHLTGLDLRGVSITDADLVPLATIAGLISLHLNGSAITDAGLVHLIRLPKLARLDIDSPGVTDAGLKTLTRLAGLRRLAIPTTRVTDAGLVHLSKFPLLAALDLRGTLVTDAGMATLGQLTGLTRLTLSELPGVTDAGLASLCGLTRLKMLYVTHSPVSDTGIAALKQALPGVRILR